MRYLLTMIMLCFELPVHAASLYWDGPVTGTVNVEMGATATGPFSVVASVPATPNRYVLTPGRWGFYRLAQGPLASNAVQYSVDLANPDLTPRVDTLESGTATMQSSLAALQARVVTLETKPAPTPVPAPASNLTVRQIDADNIEVVCNGIGITTTGTGTKRLIQCRH